MRFSTELYNSQYRKIYLFALLCIPIMYSDPSVVLSQCGCLFVPISLVLVSISIELGTNVSPYFLTATILSLWKTFGQVGGLMSLAI